MNLARTPSTLRALVSLGVVATVAAVLFSSPGVPAATTPVRDYEIVYRAAPDSDNGPGTLHVWFSMPSRWRVETRTTKVNETVVAAGDSVFTYDRAKNAVLWQARDQADECTPSFSNLTIDFSEQWRTWQQVITARQRATRRSWEKRVGSARVRGRACDVYEQSVTLPPEMSEVPGPRIGAIKFRSAVDRQLLAPLRYEEFVDGRLRRRLDATCVNVNQGVAGDLFKPRTRPPRVYSGVTCRRCPTPDSSARSRPNRCQWES